ncbi:MAG: hypothetical protein HY926_10175 [Elusimicrobia bacterium]|nr:hypothetical protein [Elusimicrobiota bacterium]
MRCRFILEDICSRLEGGDRQGASGFLLHPSRGSFDALPEDQGSIVSCRERGGPSPGRQERTLLLRYASGFEQKARLGFSVLEDRTCGVITRLDVRPRKASKAKAVFSAKESDIVRRVKPELAGAMRAASPESARAAYIDAVLMQILQEGIRLTQERGEKKAAPDPLDRPLIQKE